METVSVSLFYTAHCKFSGTQLLIVSILCLAANIIKEHAPNQTCSVLTKILFLLKKICTQYVLLDNISDGFVVCITLEINFMNTATRH